MVRESKILVGYDIDQKSVNKVIEDTERMAKKLSETATQASSKDKKEKSNDILESAERHKKRIIEENKLLEMSVEALKERYIALQREIQANNQAIATLKASGETSYKISKQIKKYELANKELSKTLAFISDTALPKAKAKAKELGEEAQKASENIDKNANTVAKLSNNASKIASALDAIGAEGSGVISTVSTIGNLVGELPKLNSVLKNIPSAIGGIVTALGPVGIGLTAVAAGAVIVIGELSKQIDEARQRGEEYANTLKSISESSAQAQVSLAKNDPSSVIQQLSETQNKRLQLILEQERLQQELARLEEQRVARSSGSLGILDSLVDKFDPVVQEIDSAISGVKNSLEGLSNELVTTSLTQNELIQLLLDYGFTIEQIEEELSKLDQTTDKVTDTVKELNIALLNQAESIRSRYLEEIGLLEQSEQALKNRQKQIEDEIEANKRAIAVLEASGNTSEEVTKQIEKYRQANEELGKTLNFISTTALPAATARARAEQEQADKEQTERDMIEATRKFNRDIENLNTSSQEELLRIEQKRTNALLDIAKRYSEETQKALDRFNEDLENARKRHHESELKAYEDSLRDERDAARKHYEALSDISVNAKREEQDALRALDFKSAFQARRNANRAIEDEQKKFVREQQDRKIAFEDERQDRLRAYAQAQRDARENYEKELANAKQARDIALKEAKDNYKKELEAARTAHAQRIQELQKGYMQELQLAQQTSAQRLAIQQQTDAQLLASAQRILRMGFGNSRPNIPNPKVTSAMQNVQNQSKSGSQKGQTRGGDVVININNPNNPQRTVEQIKTVINRQRASAL